MFQVVREWWIIWKPPETYGNLCKPPETSRNNFQHVSGYFHQYIFFFFSKFFLLIKKSENLKKTAAFSFWWVSEWSIIVKPHGRLTQIWLRNPRDFQTAHEAELWPWSTVAFRKKKIWNSSPVVVVHNSTLCIFKSFLPFNKIPMGYSSLEWMVAVWLEPCRVESGRLSTSCSFFRRPTKKKWRRPLSSGVCMRTTTTSTGIQGYLYMLRLVYKID